jgi:hypothetical protein
LKAAGQKIGDNNVRIRIDRYVGDYLPDYLYREESLKKVQANIRNRTKWDCTTSFSVPWVEYVA